MTNTYPKRLIEVDLPIKRISEHARREKSIRHGHISTLHIWWARRPLAACRAVLCASLWPDPADPICPNAFRQAAVAALTAFALNAAADKSVAANCNPATLGLWIAVKDGRIALDAADPNAQSVLQKLLLDFIADFANWDNAGVPAYLETARALTQAAHEALGGIPGTKPLVIDPFAGGGAIPLEALRVGADAFASDLNPVAVLLNKVTLEYIPRYGQRLADEVRKWGAWVKAEAEKELAAFYPRDPDGATPIAYLWARTVVCEGPNCGTSIPLMRSLWLAKPKGRPGTALRLLPDADSKHVGFEIIEKAKPKDVGEGTVKKGAATCPVCGYTTPVARVRAQLKPRRGGAADARLFCVVTTQAKTQGRAYRLPLPQDSEAVCAARDALTMQKNENNPFAPLSLVPDEKISLNELRRISVPLYGIETWGDCFNLRQALTLATLARLVHDMGAMLATNLEPGLVTAVQTCLALVVDKAGQYNSSMCRWKATGENLVDTFGRQAVPMVWDFAEAHPFAGASGDFGSQLQWHTNGLELTGRNTLEMGHVENASATTHPLPDGVATALVTDPPYYDAIPYAYLSDFFYVWLRRTLQNVSPELLSGETVPKDAEIVVDRKHTLSSSNKDVAFYERELCRAFAEARRVVHPDGIGTIVFASKTTASWEAVLKAVVEAGWTITGSWPIDTEMETRVAAQGQARLGSSVHLVCRPCEEAASVGDWRDVLQELPQRIGEWMPRLAGEGVVGADAIFACLGPALEIFSRYARVEKASGEVVPLREYLEHVWAAVSREALHLIFADADTMGFEEDARLTAMWLWTLSTAQGRDDVDSRLTVALNPDEADEEADEDDTDDEEIGSGTGAKKKKPNGFLLEFDAARKIAQGLGAALERLTTLVEVKGSMARLLPVGERTRALFGKDENDAPTASKRGKKIVQMQLAYDEELERAETQTDHWGHKGAPPAGRTTLDRVHQAMILFAAGRADALRTFLVDGGAGSDVRFWKLAQALSALYPTHTDEKRWVDGVLARKKGLGF